MQLNNSLSGHVLFLPVSFYGFLSIYSAEDSGDDILGFFLSRVKGYLNIVEADFYIATMRTSAVFKSLPWSG